jgi:hypothetical protein
VSSATAAKSSLSSGSQSEPQGQDVRRYKRKRPAIQIWTALIAILLLKRMHHLAQAKWSLSNLASMLRINLFTYRDLTATLDNSFGTLPTLRESQQLTFELMG